jgi:hypothetical protein
VRAPTAEELRTNKAADTILRERADWLRKHLDAVHGK